ncbi:MAG: hypothetical protein PHQ23_17250, partial [Candidatus Wallbacteria bacterium]|nr:hypothetical protein [Candidatus Wallbacteria bacterium]
HQAAITAYQAVLQIQMDSWAVGYYQTPCYLGIGKCEYELGNYAAARENLTTFIGSNLNQYQEVMRAEAYLLRGLTNEKDELYADAFRDFATVISRYHEEPKKPYADYVSRADAAIDRIVRIDIDQDDTFNDDGTVTANLSARPVYVDGNQFTIAGESEWKWALAGGAGTLTPNMNLAVLNIDLQNYARGAVRAELKINLSNYTPAKSKNGPLGVQKALRGIRNLGALQKIINYNRDFLIYDVPPVEPSESRENNQLLTADNTGEARLCEPIVCKFDDGSATPYQLTFRFLSMKNPTYNRCEWKYTISNDGSVVLSGSEIFSIVPAAPPGMLDVVRGLKVPNALGKYTLDMTFGYFNALEGNPPEKLVLKTKQMMYVAFDKPKYFEAITDPLVVDRYRLKKDSFTKENINKTFDFCATNSTVKTEVCERIIFGLKKIVNFTTDHHFPESPWRLFAPKQGGDCATWAALMSNMLNIIGIQSTIRCVGDIPNYLDRPFDIRTQFVSIDENSAKIDIDPSNISDASYYPVNKVWSFPVYHVIHCPLLYGREDWNYEGVCFVDENDESINGLSFDVADGFNLDSNGDFVLRKFEEMLKSEIDSIGLKCEKIPGIQPPEFYQPDPVGYKGAPIRFYFWVFKLIEPVNGKKYVAW